MDFKLTDEGDLDLGQQQVDRDGYLLYHTQAYQHEYPAEPTTNPEIGETPIRDFKTVHEDQERLQLIQTRMKTENPDFYLYQEVGASLTDFIGRKNNRDTANEIELRVRDTLLRNDAFDEEELNITVVPVSFDEVLVDILLDNSNHHIRYAFTLDFNLGIKNTYVIDEEGNVIE